ncbi:EAL domain-containing protein [Alteromonas sp. ASW11-130]|uniref:EAL domain-containing protein n=1 Tax=Alteromonas sp. ASW11-130 TaxID=3015775 RepID=UPI002241C04F|nr:EAL domain-containing protein [Alteromonas sp. ASW11-130]MCW8091081.1 EAL domain-containing protein [Alteromonas sp. ASW11-130]
MAGTLLIDPEFEKANLKQHGLSTLADKNVSLAQIINSTTGKVNPHFLHSFDDSSRMWIVSHVQNISHTSLKMALTVERLGLDEVTIWIVDERQRILHSYTSTAGEPVSWFEQMLPAITYEFRLPKNQTVTILLSVQDSGLTSLPVFLWQQNALKAHSKIHLLFLGVLAGKLAILFIYFFLSYLYQRTPARFWLALTNLLFLTLVVAMQGLLDTIFPVSKYAEPILAVLLAFILFTLAKVTHNLFVRLPTGFHFLNYVGPLYLLIAVMTQDTWYLSITLLLTAPIAGLLQVFSALLFRDRRNRSLSRIYLISWLFLTALFALQIDILASSYSLTSYHTALSVLMLSLACLSLGVCVELKERSFTQQQMSAKEQTISSLNYFYNLFRNSAEGLYTSTVDGALKSVNPAMCSVFGYEDEKSMLKAIQNTNQFYANPEDRELLVGELLEKGSVMGKEIKGRKADGNEFWFCISCQLQSEEGERFLYGSIFDITERKQSDISLEYLASHDSLTGVFNRREFELRLHSAANLAQQAKTSVVLLYLDLDRFKAVNDTCGHKAGDTLIKEIARLVQSTLAGKGIVARLGGDEFAVLFEGHSEDAAYLQAVKILNAIQSYRYIWENRVFTLGVSIGLLNCTEHAANPEQLLSMADAACYIAKEQGRNQIHRYSNDDESLKRYEEELTWVADINEALDKNSFELYYQHYRVLNAQQQGDYFEILLRMVSESGELIPPSAFFPSAERYDLSTKIDRWVVENTFKWLADNSAVLEKLERCCINLSGPSLADKDIKLLILNAFERSGVPYEKICFEITETVAIVKMEDTLQFMKTFNQLGCQFALDDFGSGFSSYTYLKHLPVNCVKIDGSFIKEMLNDPVDHAMVSSIKDVAKAMGMETVGECVEDEATMVALGKMGVNYAQGFGIAKPRSLKEFVSLDNDAKKA